MMSVLPNGGPAPCPLPSLASVVALDDVSATEWRWDWICDTACALFVALDDVSATEWRIFSSEN